MLDEAGFAKVRWGRQIDVFSGSKHESDAKDFDTHGVTFAGVKASEVRSRQPTRAAGCVLPRKDAPP